MKQRGGINIKTLDQKREFIARRVNGESYSKIAGALKISKSTCSSWDHEMQAEIALAKQESLNELYFEYGMQKAARIRRLGDALRKIDNAIERIDLSEMPPDKLLTLKLKYEEALREEYTGAEEALPIGEARASDDSIFYLYSALFERVRNGETSISQAKIEMAAISGMKKAYAEATSAPDLAEMIFTSTRSLEAQVDPYAQIGEHDAADQLSEPRIEDHAEAEAPLSISPDAARSALVQQLKRLIRTNDVNGLAEFLSTYLRDEDDAPEIES